MLVISAPFLLSGDAADEKIVSISGSSDTLLALSAKGELFIWGQCEYGQAGIGNDTIQVVRSFYMGSVDNCSK